MLVQVHTGYADSLLGRSEQNKILAGNPFSQSQSEINKDTERQHNDQDSRPVRIMVPPFCNAMPQTVRSVCKYYARIRNGHESRNGEDKCRDQADAIFRSDEVEESGSDGTNENAEMQPFLEKPRAKHLSA